MTRAFQFESDGTGFSFAFADALVASQARKLFVLYLSGQVDSDSDLFGVELIFGELIANVVTHAQGPLDVRLQWLDRQARLEIIDHGPGYDLRATLPDDAFAETHRGLFIVAAYAEELRVERRDGLTVTSVLLPVFRRSGTTE